MDFRKYQQEALKTDRIAIYDDAQIGSSDIIVPLLGLAGEAGQLLSAYKKNLRDGQADIYFKDRVSEELGDLLWYISNTASKFNLDLEEIAKKNIIKCIDRWGEEQNTSSLLSVKNYSFDDSFPHNERLPREFIVQFEEVENNLRIVKITVNGISIGNQLTDNSYDDDGYRFHDVFHLAFVAILGWSPVIRKLMGCKRKSDLLIDEVEDGGRAIAIEEGITALIFSYAQKHNYLEGISIVDYHLLKTIKGMTSHLEISQCSQNDWEKAILKGFESWRFLNKKKGGKILINIDSQEILCMSS